MFLIERQNELNDEAMRKKSEVQDKKSTYIGLSLS